MSNDHYEESIDALAHEIWAAAQLAPGEGIVDGVDRIVSLLRREGYPAVTHCDKCGNVQGCDCPICTSITALRERLAETANDLTRCPNCGGPADNGHDREVPPNPYFCSKCMEA